MHIIYNLCYIFFVLDVIGFHGGWGSSKTWGEVLFAWLYQKDGYVIWSDIELNSNYFPNYVNINTDKNINWEYLQNCAVYGQKFPYPKIFLLFDEWQYKSDARLSRDMQNVIYSWLFNQSRKRGLIIVISSKKKGRIDLRSREDEDITIKCTKYHDTPDIPEKHMKKCFKHDCLLNHFFDWLVIDNENAIGKHIQWTNPLISVIFPMYNTDELMQAEKPDFDIKDLIKGMKQ